MLTSLTSSSLTADRLYDGNVMYFWQKPDKAFWIQLVTNICGAHVALATLGGVIGKPILEASGWTVNEINDQNFPLTMAAGGATLCLVTISGMIMLSNMVEINKISQNTATFIIGLPFNAGMGACYALAGSGMQHLLSTNDTKAFVAAAGAIGNAIAYLSLAAIIRRPFVCLSWSLINISSCSARLRVFAPALLLGKKITYSETMSISYLNGFEAPSPAEIGLSLAAIYAANLLIAVTSGLIGYSMLDANKWSADEINGPKFIESMAAGAAILSLVTTFSMGYISELVTSSKISQNAGMFAIGIPLYSIMGALYGLTGASMQNLLKNPENIAFTATAGSAGAAITYTTLASMMEGINALRRTCEIQPILYLEPHVERKNCFLKMYNKVCCTKSLEQIVAEDNNLQQGLLEPVARDNNLLRFG